MPWITDTPADDDPDIFDGLADQDTGRVDNILKVHALHPEGLRAHVMLYETVMRGTPSLPKVDRELLALRVSQINQCRY